MGVTLMNTGTAIKLLNMYLEFNPHRHDFRTAIEIVLTEIDGLNKMAMERYDKGYQDGFKQAKFDCEMDKLDGR